MVDRAGQQLGNYRLIRLLGEGAFAEVYLGEHVYLRTQAAIKVLHTQLTDDDIEKFRIEAFTIAHLIHPNIVRVLEFGVEGKTPFLVMDYAPNGTLRQRHPKGVTVPLGVIVPYVNQIADALQYAHDEKLVHRDVKPENMLLGRRGEILLSDFGIALITQSSRYQSTFDMAGTMAYMAPEQIQGKPRPASDQYSLGIVVYEWLSGIRPFQGSFTEIVGQHLSVPPPPLRGKVPTLAPDVEQVIMTVLAKDPKQRFANIQAFAAALAQASQFETPTFIKPVTPAIQPPSMTVLPNQPPPPTAEVAQANYLPAGAAFNTPHQSSSPTNKTIPSDEQHWSTQPGSFTQPPRSKRTPHPGVIIGILLLLVVIIGSSILFFTMNKTNTQGTTGGNTPSSTMRTVTPGATGSVSSTPVNTTITPPNDLITPGSLTIGSDTTYPPQEFIDTATGQSAGFDIDLITAMAQKLGLQANVKTANFSTILDNLKARRFDIVISAVSITAERQSMFDFVPYFNAGESLLVQAGNPKNIKRLSDLCGQNVGVQNGTIEQTDLQAASTDCTTTGMPAINITALANQTDVIQLLATNHVVATYQDSPVTDYYIKLNPGQFQLGGSVNNAGLEGIAIRKGDTSMFNAIKASFDLVKSDGTYHSLILKWGLANEAISMANRTIITSELIAVLRVRRITIS